MVRINSMGQAGVMHIPAPLRAAVGLVVTAADEARRLPDRALELPMLAVSTALQASVRAQQRYARLTARGDAVLHRRPASDEPPAWATFDDDPLPAQLSRPQSRFDTVAPDFQPGNSAERSARLFGELVGVDDPSTSAPNGANPASEPTEAAPEAPAARTPAKTQPRQPPATKTTARSPAKSAQSTAKSAAKSASKSTAKKSTSAARRRTSSGSDAD
jgi:hypothetical protein